MKDPELLHQFVQGSEKAFAELVRRHVDLVFAAALRHASGNRHNAEDITQKVFIDLVRKARTLTSHPSLAGWLYSSTRYTAINTLRSEQRRSAREKEFEVMHTTANETEPHWEQIRPVIDDALQELEDTDRESVLLRFFGQQPFAAIAAQLGITENAAQKRVDRALDRLSVALKLSVAGFLPRLWRWVWLWVIHVWRHQPLWRGALPRLLLPKRRVWVRARLCRRVGGKLRRQWLRSELSVGPE